MSRADRLEELIAERELDALVVTDLVNVRYLCGYTGSNGICVIGRDLRLFFTDFRYVTQAAEQVPPEFERIRGKRDLLGEVAERISGRVGFEDAIVTVRRLERLRGLVGDDVDLVGAGDLVEQLRAVKDRAEIAAIRAAAELADEALRRTVAQGVVGRTERHVALELETEMRRLGAEAPAFTSIVASGAHSALPHAEPRDVTIAPDTLLTIDWGAQLDGYCSDCTRTFATGELEADAAAVYALVLHAQQQAEDAVRAGAAGTEVDRVARAIIEEAGHGEHFGHGLGHGVGLEVHEGPTLSQLSTDDALAPGNVVTVEPGVYVPDRFGVRIEDLVVVTEEGCEVLSGLPKELERVG